LTDTTNILYAQCQQFVDPQTNTILTTPSANNVMYPSTTCGCFLPQSVYKTFWNSIYAANPSFQGALNNPQCSYPDCAATQALQPQTSYKCPDLTLTSCISQIQAQNISGSQLDQTNQCVSQTSTTTNGDGTPTSPSAPSDGSNDSNSNGTNTDGTNTDGTNTDGTDTTASSISSQMIMDIVIGVILLVIVLAGSYQLFFANKPNPV
jgi:hypothetical protein